MIAAALILPIFTEFVYALVGKNISAIFRILNFGLTLIIISTIYTNIYAYDGGPFLVFNYWPVVGLMSFVQIILYAANVFFSHRELLFASISGNYPLRAQAKIILVGTSLGYLGGATNFLLWFRIPFPPVLNILIPIYIISVAYAITKHRLMDISVVISRGVAEGLTVFFLGSIYLGLTWLYQNYVSSRIDLPFLIVTILYGILVGQTHQRIRLFLQTTSDKLFLRGRYDYYKELSEVSSQIAGSLSIDNILQSLHRTFYEVIEVSEPRVYLEKDFNNPKVKEMLSVKEPAFRDGELILPCVIENRTIALIVLGPKLSEDPYTDEDIRLLRNLANQTAAALDHQRVYEEALKTRRQLLWAEKLASLGDVAADAAREIKKPLLALKEISRTRWDNNKPETVKNFKESALKEIDHLNSLVNNLLKMAKGEATHP